MACSVAFSLAFRCRIHSRLAPLNFVLEVIWSTLLQAALSGRDVVGIAQTGSGKTAAFLLPMVVHCVAQPRVREGQGPIVIIIAPVRELAEQIHREARRCAVPPTCTAGVPHAARLRSVSSLTLSLLVHLLCSCTYGHAKRCSKKWRITCTQVHTCLHWLRNWISFCLIRGNARGFQRCLGQLIRGTGIDFQPGANVSTLYD
jgi:hypothetical protein